MAGTTQRYKFLLARTASSAFTSLGEYRVIDDEAAKRRAVVELQNEEARHGLEPAARILIQRADDTLVGDYDCAELLAQDAD